MGNDISCPVANVPGDRHLATWGKLLESTTDLEGMSSVHKLMSLGFAATNGSRIASRAEHKHARYINANGQGLPCTLADSS
jgi:hypothetical protein